MRCALRGLAIAHFTAPAPTPLAIVLAPFFAHLELMFLFFNFKPSLQRAIAEGAKVEKAKFLASKKGRTGRKLE